MRVLLCTAGSYGDVNPFLAIGQELIRRGHEAAVFVNPYFEPAVREAGLEFLPQAEYVDIPRFIADEKILDEREGGKRLFRTMMADTPKLVPRFTRIVDHDWRPDLVAVHPLCTAARWICDKRSIRHVSVALAPAMWWSLADPVPTVQKGPGTLSRVVSRLLDPPLRWVVRRAVGNEFRKMQRTVGLEPEPVRTPRDWYADDLTVGMWSPHLRGETADDPRNGVICGFPWYDGAATREPDPELQAFLDAGDPPVVFSLGTSAVHVPGNFYEQAAEACRRLGRRGILLCSSADAGPSARTEDVRTFGYVPFSQVLSRGCATVIHGGIGTLAQALRAGRPTIVVPFAHDQFNNAVRVDTLGLGAAVARTRAGADGLAGTLDRLLGDPALLERCREMGARLEDEDGASKAVDLFERKAEIAV